MVGSLIRSERGVEKHPTQAGHEQQGDAEGVSITIGAPMLH